MKKIIENSKRKSGLVSLLGIAAKAGKLYFGTDRICDEIRRKGVPGEEGQGGHGIVLASCDASANTVKRLENACKYYNVTFVKTDISSSELASKLGKTADAAAVAVFDRDFRIGILKKLTVD